MIYQHKYTNLPMSLLETKIRQGGWHEYNYYFDMGHDNSILFSDIHGSHDRNFSQSHNRMDTLHRPKTITGILPFADPAGQKAHDAYHRFFPDASWAMSELWRLLTILLVRIFYPTGVISTDLDDTLFHHSGRKGNGAGWWRDAVRSTGTNIVHAWGLNLVVLTLRINPPWGGEPLGLPINMRLHRKNGPTLIKLASQMLTELALWLSQRRFLCSADGFYASLAGEDIPNTHIISRMRRDANIYDLLGKKRKKRRGRPRKKGKQLPSP